MRFSPRLLGETRLCGARAGHSIPRSGRSFSPLARRTPLRLCYHPEEGADLRGEMPVGTPRYVRFATSGPGNRVCRASQSRFASRSRAIRMCPHETTKFVKTTARGKCVLVTTSFRLVHVLLPTLCTRSLATPKCPPRTDGPRAADILTHDISSAIAACTFALPPAPRTRAQVRLAPVAPTTPAMRSQLMDLHEHAARGVRRAHRRPLGARRWCARRERRAAGTWVGGCGEQPGHGDDRERRSSSRQRARRSRRRGTSGGCSEHARQMGAAPPPPAAPPTNRRLGDRGARRQLSRPPLPGGGRRARCERGAVTGTCQHRS